MDSNLSDSQIISQISSKQRMIKFLNFIHPLLFIAMPAAIFWGFANWDRNIGKGIFFVILGLLCIPFLVVLGKSVNALERKIKSLTGEYLVKGVLAEKVQVEKYAPNEYINPDFVKNCNIIPDYDRISGSDYVSGTYRGVPFTFCDLHLQYKDTYRDKNGRKRTRYRTNFLGHVITLDTKTNINGFVRICERKNPRKENGFLSGIVSGAAEFLGMNQNKVEMESDPFNQQFKVITSDDELAFYILTPQFMEHIVAADEKVDGYTKIEFENSRVTLALNNGKNSFELTKTLWSKSRLDETRLRFRDEFQNILSIIDEILTKDNLF